MSVYHDEIEIEDMEYNEEEELYTYPCPCGDEFIITKVILMNFFNIIYTCCNYKDKINFLG